MTNPKCIACGVELEAGWAFAHCGRKECSVLRRKECPYCKRPADEQGGINHVGGCTGLQDVPMNRLQYDILRGNLSLAEEGLVSYVLEVERKNSLIDLQDAAQTSLHAENVRLRVENEQLQSRLEGSQAAAAVGEREIERLQVRINGYADTNVVLRAELAALKSKPVNELASNNERAQASHSDEPSEHRLCEKHGVVLTCWACRDEKLLARASPVPCPICQQPANPSGYCSEACLYRAAEKS